MAKRREKYFDFTATRTITQRKKMTVRAYSKAQAVVDALANADDRNHEYGWIEDRGERSFTSIKVGIS